MRHDMTDKVDLCYGSTLYAPETLKEVAKIYSATLRQLLKQDKSIEGLVSTGSSGAILASAMMVRPLMRNLYHVHVNKPNEGNSHSGDLSGYSASYSSANVVFIDDFISQGGSLQRCIDALSPRNLDIRYALVSRGEVASHKAGRISEIKVIWAGNTLEDADSDHIRRIENGHSSIF
jgi:orotate phosphoribosyltransferase-like protein